ncbi:MAG: D-2-hydroxyacid dehydrogenase [Clostridiales Family XIII bacterium]|jgi:glycerate dehydrogenase|nr:D-2-hydroxyacid dehydrogenase [Clostridiales Family XIII bacterium]
MRIVALDAFTVNPGDLSWDGIARFGELALYDRTAEADIASRIGGAAIVLTNKTPITRQTLEACPGIRYICVLATGYNVVDLSAARERGIPVSNIPSYSTPSVAQHVFALLLEICDQVRHHSETVREGRWVASPDFCYWDYPLIELAGKRFGIIGFGKIGRAVARVAAAFGMDVIVHSRSAGGALETAPVRFVDLDTLYRESDVISLHCPQTESNVGMIGREAIAKMKDGVIVINTARGPLVQEADMRAALESGKVGWFAADVVSREPMREDNPLLGAPRAILTPHMAWGATEARERLLRIAEGNIEAFLAGSPIHVVNG